MNCIHCSPIEPIEDKGIVKLRHASPSLASAVQAAGYRLESFQEEICGIAYSTREQLFQLIKLIEAAEEAAQLTISIIGTGAEGPLERWMSLSQLQVRFSNHTLIDIIANKEFCSYLQPIVNPSEQIVGFEFLLRPKPQGAPFQPYTLFEVARQSGFHSFLDRAARISAIESSARLLPPGIKRFINFLPSSIYDPAYCLTHTFEAIEQQGLRPEDFVFEVVETEEIDDISHLTRIFAEYRRHGILVALDDVGAGYSTVEVMSGLKPDYVKIDRGLVSFCDQDAGKQQALKEIIDRAGEFGGKVLAEGIERWEEFRFCQELGIHLAQGYLFGKPASEPPSHFLHTAGIAGIG
ncbi:EAL domain-containing protein (putative c-di-GMP-specific phosphodiesterase class I) [Paenibacillus forsythiae]|uniref:EAL domain-containing protein (Putative c-di-GMP-specific phosphodiesterase class I) n=1 Tax=Paenibacillus forsythiae TaxID=365616 RepID=A0ABU3HBR9_9BACL|nr:EAL domain-containing protein [Paenibacillus forsythiae]MDT3428180.1 EAL domain-containing protein (putative c-di-GMP-specific phosphodiesterase class I) [Paenibacillus forsythiae]